MTYSITGHLRYTSWDKVYFEVEADSPEEALKIVKDDPTSYEVDTDCQDCTDFEYIDLDDWEVR